MATLRRLAIKGLVSEVPEQHRAAIHELVKDRKLHDAEAIISTIAKMGHVTATPGSVPVPTAVTGKPVSISNWAKDKGLYG